MANPSQGPLHTLATRVFRSVAEWLIAHRLASDRLRWRVRRFEQRGSSALLSVPRIYYPHALIAANVALMVLVLLYATLRKSALQESGHDPKSVALIGFGAAHTLWIFGGEYWRLLTAVFLHADFRHLLFNCFAIWIIAPRIEAVYGPRRFLFLYLLTGIAGNAVSVYVHAFFMRQPILLIGSSGAVFGLLGAGAIYGLRIGGPQGDEIFKFMAAWIAVGILCSFFLFRGDNLAHAGGAIAGGLFAQTVRPHPSTSYHRQLWITIEATCLLVTGICFALIIYSLLTLEV